MFSLLGVTMQYKFCAWAGATFALAAFLNKRKHDPISARSSLACCSRCRVWRSCS